uniref:CSON007884 protein n=1 Tax=Culicoides sonorensis TaxID=179676 RepID=A0A336MXN6_CULSO
MLQTNDSNKNSSSSAVNLNKNDDDDSTRRRSTFYVPLQITSDTNNVNLSRNNENNAKKSLDRSFNPDLSNGSLDWSLNSSLNSTGDLLVSSEKDNKHKRYGIVLNGSINIDDSIEIPQPSNNVSTDSQRTHTSTPISLMKARSRINILSLPDKALQISPAKEKSKTLPQNLNSPHNTSNTFPPKSSFLLKSTPKILNHINYSSSENFYGSPASPRSSLSPKKSLSFVRRTHSTKLSRSNSLLKSFSSQRYSEQNRFNHIDIIPLPRECLEQCFDSGNFEESVKQMFFVEQKKPKEDEAKENKHTNISNSKYDNNYDDDSDPHSDTSYEKACRRGSAPNTPMLGQKPESNSIFSNLFSKRSNPLKRTKSVTKLERSKRGSGGLRGSRSHESLLSSHAVMSTIDLSCTNAIGVAPVHSSVLGRRHCFQVRGDPRGERYYSCGSRQERDLWIYSLRKSISPNLEHTRRTDNSLKMWIYEAKALPPKKKYFCEINLDKTLYGRTSTKLRTELLFWGEYFDFPDVPEINVITVNVYREGDKKKKRDKHSLVGSVKIPIHEVTSRTFSENWYQIISEKHESISKSSTKEPIPTLRIKCRFQSIDILPLEVYSDFLSYLKENYKQVCELLEPVIGVKAKEDIGQALVLLMYAQGIVGSFLTDVVALDLLRVGDQRLTFRGNSLATKSMEAFLKLTGEQYLQDTLSAPISEIIASDKDCEVDPLKATGSLSRQQQALRIAVKTAWNAIAESHKNFPPQLRDCFATFKERLQILDREDMADNLISASIFLRFLCPAILSPSLFNITNELPSARATRNLTLVAKTLQTLANFTRFQGKENFMEFLNDFLEQEAPRMKHFLHLISTRPACPPVETIHDWTGYIDQGKQLSILHTLLIESIQKLPIGKQQELHPLPSILDQITQAKLSQEFSTNSLPVMQSPDVLPVANQENIPHTIHPVKTAERGVIRGVLTPNSLEKNIFRYNDPTVQPFLNQSQKSINVNNHNNLLLNPLQHSHSTSSISSHQSSSTNYNSNINNNNHLNSNNIHHHYITVEKPRSNYFYTSVNGLRSASSAANNPVRANTLPRNNLNGNNQISLAPDTDQEPIQIGYDQSKAFIRKSPTPLVKSHVNGSRGRNLNGSQLSLLCENSIGRNAINLGIPHHNGNGNQITCGAIIQTAPGQPRTNNHSNMPLNLEDLDDLLNYADEQSEQNQKQKNELTGKGSNISIGVCSSGYQSITNQSQSSSPTEGPSAINGVKSTYGQIVPKYTDRISNYSHNNNNNNNPPLAFKNPLYQLQSISDNNNKSSSLTPASSEEQVNGDYYNLDTSMNGNYCDNSNLNGINGTDVNSHRLNSASRIPRTNPLHYNKRNENKIDEVFVSGETGSRRYHRRLSLESAKTLSDSSTDTEGLNQPAITPIVHHHHHHSEGKRRRNTSRSVEQCEREIQRLQASVDSLRKKLSLENITEAGTDKVTDDSKYSDSKIRSIIGSRLLSMEEELRREQYKMSMILSHKQRVIEAQGQQIAALDAANSRLLNALSSLRSRYEGPEPPNSLQGGSGSLC